MSTESRLPSGFYHTEFGQNVARVINARLRRFWPDLRGQSLLCVGYCAPFLVFPEPYVSVSACFPECLAPGDGAGAGGCIADAQSLPFQDLSFDRIILIHALETAASPDRLLRNAWQLLRDDGRLLIAVPARRGAWAWSDTTPFGRGRSYSGRQLTELLTRGLFHPERREKALTLPPFPPLYRGRAAGFVERFSLPRAGGLLVAEAVKDMWSGLPAVPAGSRLKEAARHVRRRKRPDPVLRRD
ncbi:class I SAM-dependent methyltransferase [Acetobacter sp. AN02]|uniref:class I SAM-dependent methyltransferase n=1 Tax=Acetobacter sp. AN02 TaxID=2894186 RepID=UPI0024340E8D|nr:methyltransferase domain-containing protein [Acetobacter sp. AN02]MDG6095072.1 class I SAM-dependent methyltransferase [Acetobacter sp. AN02]